MTALSALSRRLKAASRALVVGCGGGEGAAATVAAATGQGVRQQRMSDCGNANAPDFLRLNEVALLEEVAERDAAWPPITRALAGHHGFALVMLPEGDASAADYLKFIGEIMREGGTVATTITYALSDDGAVSRAEAMAALPDVEALLCATAALKIQLERAVL